MLDGWVIVVLVVVGIYDLQLYLTGKPTLSQMYQKLFPTWVDMMVFIACLIVITSIPEPLLGVFPRVLMGGVSGHITWPNTETYKKGD